MNEITIPEDVSSFIDFAKWLNTATNSLFWPMILIFIWGLAYFVSSYYNDTAKSLFIANFAGLIFGSVLLYAGLISVGLLSLFVALSVLNILYIYLR